MHNAETKYKARQLRVSGMSLKMVAKTLGISKGTASVWLRDVRLPKERLDEARAAATAALIRYQRGPSGLGLATERALMWRQEAFKEWSVWKSDPLFILGVGLYWGEGSKTERALRLSNADPDLIRTWCAWLHKFAPSLPLRAQVYCHLDVDKYQAITYWRNVSRITTIRAYDSTPVSSKGVVPRRRLPFGTFGVVPGVGSAMWHTKMMVWITLAGKM